MSTQKLYLVEFSRPDSAAVRLLVPADTAAKAKSRVLDAHLSVRLVGGVEALALSGQGVVVLATGAAS